MYESVQQKKKFSENKGGIFLNAIANIFGGVFCLFVIGLVVFIGFDFIKRYGSLAVVTIAIALGCFLLKIGGKI